MHAIKHYGKNKKNYASEDWIVLGIIIKHIIKILEF